MSTSFDVYEYFDVSRDQDGIKVYEQRKFIPEHLVGETEFLSSCRHCGEIYEEKDMQSGICHLCWERLEPIEMLAIMATTATTN